MTKKWIDAAINGEGKYKGKAYLFKGDQYARYDWAKDRTEAGTMTTLNAWKMPPTFAGNLDGALEGKGKYAGKGYFFKGGQYVRYDWATERCEAGYPQPLSAWGLSGSFASGITACLNGEGQFEGAAYFFKGTEYVRYDWATDTVAAGYPRPLSVWNLPAPFSSGIDACLNGRGAYKGKAYFFKGDQYIRYDWALDAVDKGPTPIVGNWSGVVELLAAGLAKSEAFRWVWAALPQVQAYRLTLQNGVPFPFNKTLFETALRTHFHVEPGWSNAQKLTFVNTIAATMTKQEQAIHKSPDIFRARTDAEVVTDGWGDTAGKPTVRAYANFNGKVSFTSLYPKDCGPMCRAAILAHEVIHYVDDHSGEANIHVPEWFEPPQVNPEIPKYYSAQTADEAVHNPCSYASFAAHLFFGDDRRYGYGRILD